MDATQAGRPVNAPVLRQAPLSLGQIVCSLCGLPLRPLCWWYCFNDLLSSFNYHTAAEGGTLGN